MIGLDQKVDAAGHPGSDVYLSPPSDNVRRFPYGSPHIVPNSRFRPLPFHEVIPKLKQCLFDFSNIEAVSKAGKAGRKFTFGLGGL